MIYRVKQFWWAVSARALSAETHKTLRSILTPSEYTLFQKYSLSDQTHSVRVLNLLQTAGQHHPSLLKAALLHDIGKTALSLTVWDRTLNVLASILVPNCVNNWGRDLTKPYAWRKPFIMREQHAHWGADMAAAVNSDKLTCTLIRQHQDDTPPDDQAIAELWQYLKWADDQN